MVYVGANDGMLHGFDAETGVEVSPSSRAPCSRTCTSSPGRHYSHHFFVDGTPTVGDAF